VRAGGGGDRGRSGGPARGDGREGWRAMSWKKIPFAFRIAAVLQLVSTTAWIVNTLANTHYKQAARIHLAQAGIGLVIKVMAAVGVLDLARTRVGRAALGARIAFGALVAELALTLGWTVMTSKMSWMDHHTLNLVLGYAWNAVVLVVIVGLAIATERLGVAIAGVVLGFVAVPPEVVAKPVFDALALGPTTTQLVSSGMQVLHTLVLLGLVAFAARGEPAVNDPPRAVDGFRRAARALWMRVIAAAIVPALTLFMVGTRSGGIDTLRYAMIAAAAFNLWALVQFAVGVLQVARARLPDMTTWLLVLASGCALWYAGLLLAQTPELIRMMFDDKDYMREMGQEYAQAWSIVAPVVAIASIALVVGAIAGFAGRRLNNELHTEAAGKGVGFVIVMFVAIAIQSWLLPFATSTGSLAFLILTALVCGLWGTVMMANLCTRAADAIDAGPMLPTAKLV